MSKSSKKKNPTNTNIQSILEQVKVRDFYGKRKVFFTLSSILMVVGLLLLDEESTILLTEKDDMFFSEERVITGGCLSKV